MTADQDTAFTNFVDEYLEVEAHNVKFAAGNVSFSLRCTSRADLTVEEKRAYMNGFALTASDSLNLQAMKNAVQGKSGFVPREPEPQPEFPPAPDSLDYRDYGYVTEVVDQGDN